MANYGDPTEFLTNSGLPDDVLAKIIKEITKQDRGDIALNVVDDTLSTTNIPAGSDLVVVTRGGKVDISTLSTALLKDLNALVFNIPADADGKTQPIDLTIKAKKFDGTVELGNGNDTLLLTTNKGVLIDGRAGDDSITAGGGNDSIVVGLGNDSVDAGKGNDLIKVSGGEHPKDTKIQIEGGGGVDKLDLSDVEIENIVRTDKKSLEITLTDGTVLEVKNVEQFVYDRNHNGLIGKGETLGLVKLVGVFEDGSLDTLG
jgi:Ca2+-binding RTX toxin-like protein